MNRRTVVSFLIGLGLIVLVFILIIKALMGGGSTKLTKTPLANYASTATEMRLTVDGPINADSLHRQVQIIVGRGRVRIDVMKGYEGTTVGSKVYGNNQAAYNAFLHALDYAGYLKGNDDPALKDETGRCATGSRYIFEIVDGEQVNQRYWSTTCGGGTYKGARNATIGLFKAQVPDFDRFSNDFDFSF